MFFMMGITDGRKDFDFNQVITCDECGRYGRYQVYMTYMVLSLFFIPCFKWNRHYYVQTTCCNALYELDPEIGRRIARGEDVEILPQHLQRVNPQYGYGFENGSGNTIKRWGIQSFLGSLLFRVFRSGSSVGSFSRVWF